MSILDREANARFGRGLARACAGAVIFGLPLLMTMEMWWLGFHMPPGRIALLTALFLPFLVALSWHAGFEPTFSWRDDVVDALVAYAVGIAAGFLVLVLLGVIDRETTLGDAVGKVALQAIPASVGALLAQSLLGQKEPDQDLRGGTSGYGSEVFVMAVGALFLAFNLAPTDEMLAIGLRASDWHTLALMVVALALMHAFVYSVAFRGGHDRPPQASAWSLFLRFTVVGYALALVLSAAILWFFGRLEGLSLLNAIKATVVLAFPAAIGAAAARLIL